METSSGAGAPNPAPADPAHILPAKKNTLMGVLSYLGPLVIISYLVAKDDPFVKFHAKQGAFLFIIEIVLWVLESMFWYVSVLWMLWNIVGLILFVLAIIGIVNVVQGNEKELPLVGGFARGLPL